MGGPSTRALQTLEHQLHPVVAHVVLPIFALANAGVAWRPQQAEETVQSPAAKLSRQPTAATPTAKTIITM